MPEALNAVLHDPIKLGLILSGVVLLLFVLRDLRPLRLGLCAAAGAIGWWATGPLQISWFVDGWEVAAPVGAGLGIFVVLVLMALLDV